MSLAATRIAAGAALMAALAGFIPAASAQDHRQNEPGKFDFYLLTLSWSPSFCAETAERNSGPGEPESAMRATALFLRGPWAVAAI